MISNVNNKNTRSRYAEKLLDNRWQQRKSAIQIRDQFTCQKCKAKDKTVHVHHRHYQHGWEPWDYPDDLLVLLCSDCHKEEEECAEILTEMAKVLHRYGFFNTEIRDFVNNLIESKTSEKNGKG
jgi:hypothetical protein